MKNGKTTIQDIANEVKVSKTVVSNYLNGKFHTMSGSTREKIKQVIEESGYEPNNIRRNFKKKHTGMIGLIIPDITDSFISTLCKGISDAGFYNNYNVIMANTNNNIVRENTYIESMVDRIDGLIIGSVGNNDTMLTSLENKIPVVLSDRYMETLKYDTISSNNYEAIQELMQYLYTIGYEEFALFTEVLLPGAARTLRAESYLAFAKENNLEESAGVYVISIDDERTAMRELTSFISRTKNKKRVIIAVNGRCLLQTIAAVQDMGLCFPEDIGLCGYDDFEWASVVNKGITTIHQPTYEMGYRCVEQLVKRIKTEGEKDYLPEEIRLRSKLIIRGSL